MKEVPLADSVAGNCTAHLLLRKLSEQDRGIMEKGIKAFVSFIRAYKEHQCKFIFRLADMDLAQLATALGLLQLPKMPEVNKAWRHLQRFQPSHVTPQSVKVSPLHATLLCTWKQCPGVCWTMCCMRSPDWVVLHLVMFILAQSSRLCSLAKSLLLFPTCSFSMPLVRQQAAKGSDACVPQQLM